MQSQLIGNTEQQQVKDAWERSLQKIEVLGEGASAVSYLCDWQHEQTGATKRVVVKQYKHSFSLADSQKIWRESNVLGSIQHPRIPKYLGHYVKTEDGRRVLNLIVEYIDGLDLYDTMKQNRWTLSESLGLVHQLLKIVEYLQALQPPILHRDIKPSNLLLSRDSEGWLVHLIDFGTAIDSIHSSLGATHNVGTIGYMAPEQISGQPTMASDVYGVGVVAWELLTRRRAHKHLVGFSFEWQRSVQHLPSEVVDWFERMLAADVSMRFQSAHDALLALERLSSFDGDAVNDVDVPSLDWQLDAARYWLNIVEQKDTHRNSVLQWLRRYGDRCNEEELDGLYEVLHRIALKHGSFRVVEYAQDLVMATPMGRALVQEWKDTETRIVNLNKEIEYTPSWKVFHKGKCKREVQTEIRRLAVLKKQLLESTASWLDFVGVQRTAIFSLLNAPRKPRHNREEYYCHLKTSSIGMVEVPSISSSKIYISTLLVTQELFAEVMDFNPSQHKGDLKPVDSVSWWDAVIFCNRLSKQLGMDPAYFITESTIQEIPLANGFRLPRWEDWKCAARSQQVHRFAGASDPDLVGWVDKSVSSSQRVATKEPNAWGFYDMTGNVAEWCWNEGVAPQDCMKRLIAGGSYRDPVEWVRIDAANFEDPRFSSQDLGFRISRRLVKNQ